VRRMNSFRLAWFVVLSLAVSGLSLPGCEKKATKEEVIAAGLAPLAKVPAEERARAQQQVDRVWAEVKPRVLEAYNPPPAQMEFYLDLAALTKFPHRLAGYGSQPDLKDKDVPGSAFAARYVAARLKAMGVELVAEQEFPVVQPVQTECVLEADGDRHAIYEMRPCSLLPSITPAEGLAGKTLYAAKGDLAAYGSERPRDRIVVLDLDCEKNWLTPFALGARAVLFIGQDEAVDKPFLHVNVPANLPRFYVPKDLAEKLELKTRPREVKILASCRWTALTGRNVVAVVRGTDPHFAGNEKRRQAIVLAAPLDSLSEVPRLSAGARDAANCAALLQLARTFQEAPLRRDVVLCFFDGQTQAHAGARAFYGALFRDECDGRGLEKRIKDFDDERQFRDRIIAVCGALVKRVEVLATSQFSEKPGQEELKLITAEMKDKFTARQLRDAAGVLEEEARGLGTQLLDRLRPLRILRRDLKAKRTALEKRLSKAKKDGQPAEEVESLDKEIGAISARMSRKNQEIEALNDEFLGWNWVQRDVHKERLSENPKERADVIRRLGKLLKMTEALQSQRNNQLSNARRKAEQAGALRKTIGPGDYEDNAKNEVIVLHVSLNFGDARERWSFIHGDDAIPLGEDKPGSYAQIFDQRILRASGDADVRDPHVRTGAVHRQRGHRTKLRDSEPVGDDGHGPPPPAGHPGRHARGAGRRCGPPTGGGVRQVRAVPGGQWGPAHQTSDVGRRAVRRGEVGRHQGKRAVGHPHVRRASGPE